MGAADRAQRLFFAPAGTVLLGLEADGTPTTGSVDAGVGQALEITEYVTGREGSGEAE